MRQVARFLRQSCGIYRYSDIESVYAGGTAAFSNWFDSQFASAPFAWQSNIEYHTTDTASFYGAGTSAYSLFYFNHACDPSQRLRWKVGYAVNKFFPVNFANIGSSRKEADHGWLDQIEPHLFGNFRGLIEAVSKTFQMGCWLTFVGNTKATETNQPDENYAREIMQLFTIGLWELHDDGTRKKTGELDPSDSRYVFGGTDDVPTYTLADVRGLARVFTGWGGYDSSSTGFSTSTSSTNNWLNPMRQVPIFHETGEKTFLGLTIPAGKTGQESLTLALDHLFNHPSCPPFFCRTMIQHLTTSNPSRGYVSRVVAAFKDNGQGVRGDMKAVWKAIFMDQEARSESVKNDPNWGRVLSVYELSMPVFRLGSATAWRRPDVAWDGVVRPYQTYRMIGSGTFSTAYVYSPPSVFGNFQTSFSPSSDSTAEGRVAPELQQYAESSVPGWEGGLANSDGQSHPYYDGSNRQNFKAFGSNLGDFMHLEVAISDLTGTNAEIAERVNLLAFGGEMSSGLMSAATTYADSNTAEPNWSQRFVRRTFGAVEQWVQR